MAQDGIGYTPEKIRELGGAINEWLNGMPEKISSAWTPLQTTLTQEWVGEDEQSYEATVIKRINELYNSACDLVDALCKELKQLGENWHTFQTENKLEGAEAVGASAVDLEPTVALNRVDAVITFSPKDIANSEQRGLINGTSSKGTIESSLTTFVDAVKTAADELSTKAGDLVQGAFYGSQVASLQTYLEQYQKALGVVLTAVQDMREGLETLANSAYTTSDETVSSEFGQDPTEQVTQGVSDVKWQG
ncbi:MAG: hypothetical protein IKJ43_00595 [Bacilli bacterium]|nr:hypothetical protein [Bacilli bacterium]